MKPNKVPFEGAPESEQIEYLTTHIENLNEKIVELQTALKANEEDRHLRGWAAAQAGRIYEQQKSIPQLSELEEIADWFYDYANVSADV